MGCNARKTNKQVAEKGRVKVCCISGTFRTFHRPEIFCVVSESSQLAPAATRFLQWKTMWFLFNSAQRDHRNTDVYLTGFRIDVELSLYPCIHRSYHTATGKQASVSNTFLFHQTLVNIVSIVINNKHAVAKVRASREKMIRTRLRGKRLRWSRGSVLAFGTEVRGFKPGRSRLIFLGEKILSTPSFGGEVKPSVYSM